MPLLYGGSYKTNKQSSGLGGGYGEAFDEYNTSPVPSLEELQQKYLGQMEAPDIPRDPEKIYEGMMGPARTDVQGAQEKIGLGLQRYATGGSSYEDMISRYLPGATEQMADVASKAGVASTEFAQKGEVAQSQAMVARQQVANEMAVADKQIQEDSRRFMLDMKARIEMAEREIRAKERIALQQARSAEHIARIRSNAEMERARIAANASMETTKYAQEQENYRNNVRMQVYDKWYTGNLEHMERQDIMAGTDQAGRYPNVPWGSKKPYGQKNKFYHDWVGASNKQQWGWQGFGDNYGYGGGEGGATGY
jgi:hypothetical protein